MRWLLLFPLFFLCSCKEEKPQVLEIRIAFGYKDARPARFVGDRYERLSLLQELTKPCPDSKQQICGFQRSPDDADLLEKTISHSGENLVVRLWVTASSAGPDDETNRRNPYQTELTSLARKNFYTGLESHSAIFYVGHSRDGGGPDFTYPRLGSDGHVDYAYYKRNKPGLTEMRGGLSDKINTPLLAIVSCASTKLFSRKMLGLSPRTKLITVPELLYYSDALELVRSSISHYVNAQLAAAARRTRT